MRFGADELSDETPLDCEAALIEHARAIPFPIRTLFKEHEVDKESGCHQSGFHMNMEVDRKRDSEVVGIGEHLTK